MRQLRIVGVDTDSSVVECEIRDTGEKFALPLDDRLRAAARGEYLPSDTGPRPPVTGTLRPREIQDRIRHGASPEEVAADAGVPLWFLPQAKIWHKAGGSAGGMLSVYYITRNTLYLTCKGKSKAYARAKTAGPLAAGAARYALTRLLGRKKGRSYGAWRGALDFWRGKMGRME